MCLFSCETGLAYSAVVICRARHDLCSTSAGHSQKRARLQGTRAQKGRNDALRRGSRPRRVRASSDGGTPPLLNEMQPRPIDPVTNDMPPSIPSLSDRRLCEAQCASHGIPCLEVFCTGKVCSRVATHVFARCTCACVRSDSLVIARSAPVHGACPRCVVEWPGGGPSMRPLSSIWASGSTSRGYRPLLPCRCEFSLPARHRERRPGSVARPYRVVVLRPPARCSETGGICAHARQLKRGR